MEIKGLGFIPLLMAFWCVAWLSACYTLTIIHGHASPLMYISDAGCSLLEHILFVIAFVGMSIGNLVLTSLNYHYIMFHTEAFRTCQARIQILLLAVAWSSCAATAAMASFSMDTYMMTHRVSAFIAFGFGIIYNIWQSILLYKVPGIHRVLCHVRTASCSMALICMLIFIGSRVSEYTNLCDGYCEINEVISKVVEWMMMLLVLICILTYYGIMQSLSVTMSWKGFTIHRREKNPDCPV